MRTSASLTGPAIHRALPIEPVERPCAAVPMLAHAWQCDLSDDTLRWDRGVFTLFGISPGTRLDRRATAEMYCEESREVMERLRADAIASQRSFTIDAQIRRMDGVVRWMRLTTDILVANGRVTHLYGSKRDITDEVNSNGDGASGSLIVATKVAATGRDGR